MMSLIAGLETCEYELICIRLHKWGKSTDTIERLKASNVENFTLDGKKFHTFTVLECFIMTALWTVQPTDQLYDGVAWQVFIFIYLYKNAKGHMATNML